VAAEIRKPAYLPWQAEVLQQALSLKEQQRLPHAVLIETGSDRDMSEFAWHLSMLLLCDSPKGTDVCGDCDACRMMLANIYADFKFVSLEHNEKTKKLNKNINIEQVRNLIHEVHLTRRHSRLKIIVIYPAEKMNISSANSLLKTLEEPGEQVLLLLLTHNKGRIPITIRSRCQSWVIKQASTEQAMDWLTQQGLAGDDAERYLAFANGDPVLALDLLGQDYASMVEQFKTRFTQYLRGETSVTALCSSLVSYELTSIRRLINMTLSAYCYRMSGIDSKGKVLANANPGAAQAVLGLQLQAQQQLLIEENNLDLQLQLEDVLISLKEIITRRSE